jgi:hypothetical protein
MLSGPAAVCGPAPVAASFAGPHEAINNNGNSIAALVARLVFEKDSRLSIFNVS